MTTTVNSMPEMSLRRATEDDCFAIAAAYNDAIDDGDATFDTTHVDPSRYVKYLNDPRSSLIVNQHQDVVTGWCLVTPISDRWAYRFTAQGSFFVRRGHRGQGVGRILKKAQIDEAQSLGYRSLIVEVLSTNSRSVALNLESGFAIVGEEREAGYRNGHWIGLIRMQMMLERPDDLELSGD
jgi:L-amino acid N-acyltransferase